MNNLFIEGNLTRDPEVSYTQSGKAVVKFAIAHEERFKKGGEWESKATFWNVEYWTEKPDFWTSQLVKGKGVTLHGRITCDTWEKDGQKQTKVKIVLNEPPVIKSRGIPKNDAQGSDFVPPRNKAPSSDGEFFDDDVPF